MGVPLTTSPQTRLGDVIAHMSEARASCIVITEQGQPTGIFTEHDCVQWIARNAEFGEVAIAQAMSAPLITINTTQLQNPIAVLQLLQTHHIHHLPVIDETGQLVDLVTPHTLQAQLHPSDFMKLLRVSEVMTTDPVETWSHTTVRAVLQRMADQQCRCVVIHRAPPANQPAASPIPVGIMTERDIVQLQASGQALAEIPVAQVMSQPLLTIGPDDTLWAAHQRMGQFQVRRLVVCNPQGHVLGLITQHGILQAMQPAEMLNVVQLLRDTVERLQNENIELLQAKNRELEKQMRVRSLLEDRLRASQQQMRAVFEAMRDIVLVCELHDDEIVNIELSPTCPDQFAPPDLDPASQTVAHMWRNEDQIWTAHIRQAIAGQQRVEFDYYLTLGTRQAWFTASISPMSAQTVVCVARDITERKEFEQQLQQLNAELVRSNEELERFAYVASHDLQEPLRMVISFTQLLDQQYGAQLDAEAHELIDFAVDGATRMQKLIQDLLSYARVGMGNREPLPVEMSAIIQEVQANLQMAIQEVGAEVICQDLPTVVCDRRQMLQLFQNLLANALTYRRAEPPQITIGAQVHAQDIQLWVKDNGLGIAPEYTERIFTVFQRLHSRSQYPGTGIGLAICKKIVEQQGGRIWVDSELGKGSTFFMTFPKSSGYSQQEVV